MDFESKSMFRYLAGKLENLVSAAKVRFPKSVVDEGDLEPGCRRGRGTASSCALGEERGIFTPVILPCRLEPFSWTPALIPFLLATVIPLSGASEPADGVFLQHPDSATGNAVLVPLGRGPSYFGSPEPGVRRMARTKGKWVEIVETRPPASDTSTTTTTIRNLPAQGPAREPLHPGEGIFLVRKGASLVGPPPSWTPKDRLEVQPPGSEEWLVVGSENLLLGEYHEDGDGLSTGGDVFLRIVGNQLLETVTYEGSHELAKGEYRYFQEETLEFYPLAALNDETIGSNFGTLRVRKVRK